MTRDRKKNTDKNTGKHLVITKHSPGIFAMCQKLLDHAKKSAAEAFKISLKGVIQKASEAAANLIGNKIANKVMGVLKNSKIIQKIKLVIKYFRK